MSITRGNPNRRRQFEWHYDPLTRQLIIINQDGRELMYSLQEIQKILFALQHRFSSDYFSLSNNVELLGNDMEKPGLGAILLEELPKDVNRAQGASYLGVVLEEAGYFHWNGKTFGIAWHLMNFDFSDAGLAAGFLR
jgi:hypothetical protein